MGERGIVHLPRTGNAPKALRAWGLDKDFMDTLAFAVVAFFILTFALVSGRLQKTIISPPMVFVLFGLLVSNRVLGLIETSAQNAFIQTLAELTLVLVLFTDASRIDLRLLRREHDLPIRLLSIGLPLTIICGALVATLIFNVLTFWEAFVLGVILAPTDAALGQAVVSLPKVPVRMRQALNVESGLNDGIALPFLLLFLSLAGAAEQTQPAPYWVRFSLLQLVLGPVAGIAVGYFGGKLVVRGTRSGWITQSFQSLSVLGLSVLAFSLAQLVGGNGYIAAFAAGLILGNTSRSVCTYLFEFGEAEGQLLTLLTLMLYGAVMVLPSLDHINILVVLYGILSLTVVRMLPVAISMIGVHLRWNSVLFLGWFGPRGIASILYGLLLLEKVNITGREEIFSITITTVLMSVFIHGLTALPGANWYAARVEKMKEEPDRPELAVVTEMPVRLQYHK
jgi:NhaP-type Na+/H+ or K+/H+ antiporter